jgi:spermidine synthase
MPRLSGARIFGLAIASAGFTSIVGQLVLLRELVAIYYGNELVLGLILATWLAWVAIGAWGLGRWPSSDPAGRLGPGEGRRGAGTLAAGLLAAVLLLPGQMMLVRASRDLLGVTRGALVPLGLMVLTIVLLLAPLCLLLGWQFTLGARLLAGHISASVEPQPTDRQEQARPGGLGAAYVAESLGAALGGALFSFLLLRWLNPFQMALGVGAVNLAMSALLLSKTHPLPLPGDRSQRTTVALGLAAAALLVAAWPLGGWLQRVTLGWQYDGLRFAQDSVYGRIVVTGSGEQRVFYENGLFFFETENVEAEEVAHLPLLAHPAPRRVLLIGGGVSGTLAEILRHPSVHQVQYVELDPLVVRAAQAELPPAGAAALLDPRVVLAYVDGRAYVRGLQDEHFDVVILDLPEPATGQLNRFYTLEFFAQVKDILAPGGLFALGLPWQENYPGPALQRLGASIFGALDAEFPAVALLPGERLLLLASNEPLALDPDTLSARLAERGIATRLVVPAYLQYLLTTDRIAQAQDLLESAPVRVNRDLEPISYFYDLNAWLSRFSGGLARSLNAASILKLGWLAAGLALAVGFVRFLLARRRRQGSTAAETAVPVVVGLIGLAQMTMEVVILLSFQVNHGSVYSQVGLIVTAFMAGLALGGAGADRLRWPSWDARGAVLSRWSPRTALFGIVVGIFVYAAVFPLLVGLAPPAWTFLVLALLAGGLTGFAFPLAVACLRERTLPGVSPVETSPREAVRQPIPGPRREAARDAVGRLAGLLYGMDLAGGCLGAVLSSVLLVPILGIPQTCLAVALVALAALALLI